MLTMYARLRGVPEYRIKDIVTDAINLLNLAKWADTLCGNYRYNLQLSYSSSVIPNIVLCTYLFALFPGICFLPHSVDPRLTATSLIGESPPSVLLPVYSEPEQTFIQSFL